MNKSQTGAKLSDSYSSLTGAVTIGFDFFVNVPEPSNPVPSPLSPYASKPIKTRMTATYNQLLSNLIVQKSGHLAGAVCDIFLKLLCTIVQVII